MKNVIAAMPTPPVSACRSSITSALPLVMNHSASATCVPRNAVRNANLNIAGEIGPVNRPNQPGGRTRGVHVFVGSIPIRVSTISTNTTLV